MGSNARGKHKRENRSSGHVESNDHNDRDAKFCSNEQVGIEEVVDIQNSTDDNDWCLYCKEEELEGVLFSNLKFLHREALCRLCEMGYQASVAKSPVKYWTLLWEKGCFI